MLRIIGGILFLLLWAVIWFAINPVLGFVMTVVPIVGVVYNWKDL